MAIKSYRALFFNTSLAINNHKYYLRDILPVLQNGTTPISTNLPPRNVSGTVFQVRDLSFYGANLSVVSGVFGRLRDDAPNKIDNVGAETQLALLSTDRLIEKCYFLYYINTDILVWQASRDVGPANKFAEYLSDLISNTRNSILMFNVNPLVDANSLQRVLSGDIKAIECKMARPNTRLVNQPVWTQGAFDIMSSLNAATIKLNVSAARGILSNATALIKQLVADNSVSLLRVKIDGEDDPIDLFADRIDERFFVNLNGHYPVASDLLNNLDTAYSNQRSLITAYFNQNTVQQMP